MVNADADLTEHALTTAEHEARGQSDSAPWRFIAYTRLRQEEAMGVDPVISMVRARALFEDARVAHDLLSAGLAAVALRAARLARAISIGSRIATTTWRSPGSPAIVSSSHTSSCSMSHASTPSRPFASRNSRACRASQAWQDRGITATLAVRMLQHFVGLRELGRLGPIEGLFAAGAVASDRPGMQGLLATFRLEAGDHEGTRALVQSFVDDDLATLGRDWVHETALALAAEAAFTIDWREGAAEMEASLAPAAGQLVVFTSAIAVFGRVDRYLGHLAYLQGDLDLAIERLAHARALDAACGCRLWSGWAACDEARVRTERAGRGDRQIAATLVRDAAGAARFAGSRRLLTAVRKLRRERLAHPFAECLPTAARVARRGCGT